jgi:hypothetical protein
MEIVLTVTTLPFFSHCVSSSQTAFTNAPSHVHAANSFLESSNGTEQKETTSPRAVINPALSEVVPMSTHKTALVIIRALQPSQ